MEQTQATMEENNNPKIDVKDGAMKFFVHSFAHQLSEATSLSTIHQYGTNIKISNPCDIFKPLPIEQKNDLRTFVGEIKHILNYFKDDEGSKGYCNDFIQSLDNSLKCLNELIQNTEGN